MTVTYLPYNDIEDERVRANFEYLENHGIFDSTSLGGDLTGTLPNPTLSAQALAKTLQPSKNLSDLASATSAIENLGAAFGGLGYGGLEQWGTNPATQFGGRNGVTGGADFTVKNPNGATVLFMGGMSCWANAGSAILYQYLYVDGGATVNAQVCQFYFNQGSVHMWCGTWIYLAHISAGAHSCQLVAYDANSLCNFDTNDSAFVLALELP